MEAGSASGAMPLGWRAPCKEGSRPPTGTTGSSMIGTRPSRATARTTLTATLALALGVTAGHASDLFGQAPVAEPGPALAARRLSPTQESISPRRWKEGPRAFQEEEVRGDCALRMRLAIDPAAVPGTYRVQGFLFPTRHGIPHEEARFEVMTPLRTWMDLPADVILPAGLYRIRGSVTFERDLDQRDCVYPAGTPVTLEMDLALGAAGPPTAVD